MTILDVTKLDEGDYTCIAMNKAGESKHELSLKVFGKNPWEMESHRSLEIWQHFVDVGNSADKNQLYSAESKV